MIGAPGLGVVNRTMSRCFVDLLPLVKKRGGVAVALKAMHVCGVAWHAMQCSIIALQ
jgi:hypothetical protein